MPCRRASLSCISPAVQMLALGNARLADALEKYRAALRDKVMRTVDELRKGGLDEV